MDRIVAQLLAELDGMGGSADVFVLGATNRLDLLDPSLLRPGRFDRQVYLGLPTTQPDRLNILRALTRKFHLSSDTDLELLLDHVPPNFTGADFYALASDALLSAIKERAGELEQQHGAAHVNAVLFGMSKSEREVVVRSSHFENALARIKPSLTMDQVREYNSQR
eukprot:TRINITY_DN25628_c0_g2_i1.p3 TRINITY_DN25628_c0_g2~~TRINITY_DN25628_c0_g2_i1.p3  ORF type:complete len:166 (+),score=46.36 TRINITY_DN25628_c0_g2_i1:154-651(+)